jgi:hypothetical protein
VPRKAGVYHFTIEASDALGGRARRTYTARISPRLVLGIGALSPRRAVLEAPYSGTVTASGGTPPYTYDDPSIRGLTMDRSTGVLSGTLGSWLSCGATFGVTDAAGVRVRAHLGLDVVDASGSHAPFVPSCAISSLGGADYGPTFVRRFAPLRGAVSANTGVSAAVVTTTRVTLTGRGFANVTRVSFDGSRAVFDVSSDTRLTAIVPAGARTGPLTLTTGGGRTYKAGTFTITAAAR